MKSTLNSLLFSSLSFASGSVYVFVNDMYIYTDYSGSVCAYVNGMYMYTDYSGSVCAYVNGMYIYTVCTHSVYMLKLNTIQLETPGVNHCCLMPIVYGQIKAFWFLYNSTIYTFS